MAIWNPWHGCHKVSEGCVHCYMYRMDNMYGNSRKSTIVKRTDQFDMPVKKNRSGSYKLQDSGFVFTCLTSDFFLEEADIWRAEAWAMIRQRQDLHFFIITKRIQRFWVELPKDWAEGYKNVTICSTTENQRCADERLPFFLQLPIQHKQITCEPLLEPICLADYLVPEIEQVLVGGESGSDARICDYDWVLNIRRQCIQAGISFYFRQTGAHFYKNGRLYHIPRKLQLIQADKANINIGTPYHTLAE